VKAFQATWRSIRKIAGAYNLMLCYTGRDDSARRGKVRYLRYKADESAQALTGPYGRRIRKINNEPADDS